ncbi:FkbM family methyltransferase [Candidatus Albibeggiatoa sp. nov. BB20]|uniref:FkbM family methyltransferase n=1 Tax=Candidatus Albibeggiatoa sp. nov. BB20 TaxID=3162723 RepID=UPI0033654C4E
MMQIYTVNQHQMYLDTKDSLNLASGDIFEPDEVALVKQYIKQGDVVIDIGANIGYYSLLFAQLVGETGHVIAFEPDPDNFALLQKNISLNQYRNVTLVQKAVATENSQAQLFLCDENKGMHRLYDSVCCQTSIEVETVCLDDYLPTLVNRVDFIKIDIEGAEYNALQGMQNILRQQQPALLTEFSPAALFEYGIKPQTYVDFLTQLDFDLYQVTEKLNLLDLTQLKADLDIINCIMQDLLPELKNKASMPEVVETVLQQLEQQHYPRPLVENFFCIAKGKVL